MSNIVLTNLELKVLNECNIKASEFGMRAEKIKIKRSYYYYLIKGDNNVLGNSDLVQFKEFCDNEEDLALLSNLYK